MSRNLMRSLSRACARKARDAHNDAVYRGLLSPEQAQSTGTMMRERRGYWR